MAMPPASPAASAAAGPHAAAEEAALRPRVALRLRPPDSDLAASSVPGLSCGPWANVVVRAVPVEDMPADATAALSGPARRGVWVVLSAAAELPTDLASLSAPSVADRHSLETEARWPAKPRRLARLEPTESTMCGSGRANVRQANSGLSAASSSPAGGRADVGAADVTCFRLLDAPPRAAPGLGGNPGTTTPVVWPTETRPRCKLSCPPAQHASKGEQSKIARGGGLEAHESTGRVGRGKIATTGAVNGPTPAPSDAAAHRLRRPL